MIQKTEQVYSNGMEYSRINMMWYKKMWYKKNKVE